MKPSNEAKSAEIYLQFESVVLGYGGKAILPPVDMTIHRGDFLGIVGPNGAGKTTLLKSLLGAVSPMSGRIIQNGRIRFGYVPQRESLDELFPFSLEDVVLMARYPSAGFIGSVKKEDREEVDRILEKLEIHDLADKMYRDLSGGQKQRTLIARALASNPDILVLDEPTNGMDIKAEYAIMNILEKLNATGITIIMVTHLLNLVASHAKTVMIMNHKIYQGTVDDMLKRETLSEVYGENLDVLSHEHGRCVIIYPSKNNIS